MSYRTFVVANPRAGAGQVEKEWDQIERLIRASLPECDYAFTEGPNHATLLTREALKDGWEMVVGIGGDGTFNEIANGFFEKPDSDQFSLDDGWISRTGGRSTVIKEGAILGMIPLGTGGDFRKTVGLMGGLQDTTGRLAGDETRQCDVGLLTFVGHDGAIASRYFVNIASAGIGGEVDKIANTMWKGLGGKLSFSIATTRAFLTWKNRQMDVRLDDVEEISQKFNNVVVANGEYFGGGMWVAPGAELDDGKFQVVFLGDLSKMESVRLAQKIYNGRHFDLEGVFRRTASTVSIRTSETVPVLLDVDGEQPGRLPALFELHAHAIQLKV